MHDVLIAGGGPAGAVAALVLARAGVRVTILDRARFPRDKFCGDTVNPGALALLRQLGVGKAAEDGLPIDGMIVTGERNVRVAARYGRGVTGRALTRRVLDAALIDAAAGAGAAIEEEVVVRGPLVVEEAGQWRVSGLEVVRRDGRSHRIEAPLVIAADGRHSTIARALGLSRYSTRPRRWAVGGYFEGVRGLTAYGEMHVRERHYIGVSPLPGGITNVCVVTADRALLRQPAHLLLACTNTDSQLRDRFRAARPIVPPVTMGPLTVECDMPGAPGLLLAGDAAGFIDPMTGDGLRFAIRGAELAATEAMRALEHGACDAHRRLLATRRSEFSTKWRFNRALRALVGAPRVVRTATYGAAIAPFWLRHVIRYAGDVRAA